MTDKPLVLTETRGPIFIVTINRIEARNAVDGATAAELLSALEPLTPTTHSRSPF